MTFFPLTPADQQTKENPKTLHHALTSLSMAPLRACWKMSLIQSGVVCPPTPTPAPTPTDAEDCCCRDARRGCFFLRRTPKGEGAEEAEEFGAGFVSLGEDVAKPFCAAAMAADENGELTGVDTAAEEEEAAAADAVLSCRPLNGGVEGTFTLGLLFCS